MEMAEKVHSNDPHVESLLQKVSELVGEKIDLPTQRAKEFGSLENDQFEEDVCSIESVSEIDSDDDDDLFHKSQPNPYPERTVYFKIFEAFKKGDGNTIELDVLDKKGKHTNGVKIG